MIKVIKRNGNTVPFERQKINNAILKAYNEAVKQEYKFFSFGDAMFIK